MAQPSEAVGASDAASISFSFLSFLFPVVRILRVFFADAFPEKRHLAVM